MANVATLNVLCSPRSTVQQLAVRLAREGGKPGKHQLQDVRFPRHRSRERVVVPVRRLMGRGKVG
jgi:hypothetical protein